MRMLERSPKLEDVTHLVLDEVHERGIDSDFLLIVLKKLLSKRKDLKVILMSATVDTDRFSRYLNNAPVLNVPGRTFPVTTKFLEDVIELTKFTIEERDARNNKSSKYNDEWDDSLDEESNENSNPTLTIDALSNYSKETKTTLSRINEYQIQYELIVKLIEAVASNPQYVGYSKAILVFLPGIGDIRKLNEYLLGHPAFGTHGAYADGKRGGGRRPGNGGGWLIYPLHSAIASEEQEAAFLVPPEGMRKIVLATNIAETGITIPDVTCVIDSGKHKEMRFDERRQLSRLIETFISRANATQRRGRAGRVQEGLCFHLFTKERYESFVCSTLSLRTSLTLNYSSRWSAIDAPPANPRTPPPVTTGSLPASENLQLGPHRRNASFGTRSPSTKEHPSSNRQFNRSQSLDFLRGTNMPRSAIE